MRMPRDQPGGHKRREDKQSSRVGTPHDSL